MAVLDSFLQSVAGQWQQKVLMVARLDIEERKNEG